MKTKLKRILEKSLRIWQSLEIVLIGILGGVIGINILRDPTIETVARLWLFILLLTTLIIISSLVRLIERKKEIKKAKEKELEGLPEETRKMIKLFEEQRDLQFREYIWARHRWARWLGYFPIPYHLLSSKFRFYRFTRMPPKKRKKKAKKWAKYFRKTINYPNVNIEEIIGREKEINEIMESVRYHIIRDIEVVKAHRRPPPKVFLFKGDTGMGKTLVAKAIMKMAFEEGIENGVVIKPHVLSFTQIGSIYYSGSPTALASTLDSMFSTPSIVLIDEMQQFAQKTGIEGEGVSSTEDARVKTALVEKINWLKDNPVQSILIFATNVFEQVYSDIKRRARIIDFDEGVTEENLIKVAEMMCKKYEITRLDPKKIVQALSQSLRATGQRKISYNDVVEAFDIAMEKLERTEREKGGG